MVDNIKGLFFYFLGFAIICSLTVSSPSFAYEQEIKILSASMADNIAKAGKKRIAVVDFTDLQGNITELGRFIAEELSVDLINTAKGFEVIDRNHLNRILAEHKLSLSGIVDQKTVQKLGQIAGVDALITGSITPLESSIRVVCKVIATDTARVISAAKGDIAKTKAIEELFGKGIGIGAPTGSTPSMLTKSSIRVHADDFIFEVKGCKIAGNKVKCIIAITNTAEKENGLEIGGASTYSGGPSYMYDNMGNQYLPAMLQFGTRENELHVDQIIPTHMPLKAV